MNKSWKKTKIKDSQLVNKKGLRSVTKIGKSKQSRIRTKKLRLTQSGGSGVKVSSSVKGPSGRAPSRRRRAPATARRAPAPVRRAPAIARRAPAPAAVRSRTGTAGTSLRQRSASMNAAQVEVAKKKNAAAQAEKVRTVMFKELEGTAEGTSTNAAGAAPAKAGAVQSAQSPSYAGLMVAQNIYARRRSAAGAAGTAPAKPGPPKPEPALGEALRKFYSLKNEIENQKSNLPILIEKIGEIRKNTTNISRSPNEKKYLAKMERKVQEKYLEIIDKERELKKLYESLGQGPEPAAEKAAGAAEKAAGAAEKAEAEKAPAAVQKTNKIANVAAKGFILQAQNIKNSNQSSEFKIAKLKSLKSDYLSIHNPLKEPLFFINNILSELKAKRALPKVPEATKAKAKAVAEGVRAIEAEKAEEAQRREEEALISNIMDYQSLYTKAKNANSKNILIKELLNNRGLQPIIGNIMNGKLKKSKEYKINNAAIRTLTELLNTKEAKAEVAIRKEIRNIQTQAEAKAIEGAEARKQRAEAKVAEAEQRVEIAKEAETGSLKNLMERLEAAEEDLEKARVEAAGPGIYLVASERQVVAGTEEAEAKAARLKAAEEAKVAAEQRVEIAQEAEEGSVLIKSKKRLEAAKTDLKLATEEAAAAEKAKATQAARAEAEKAAAPPKAAVEKAAAAQSAEPARKEAPPRPKTPKPVEIAAAEKAAAEKAASEKAAAEKAAAEKAAAEKAAAEKAAAEKAAAEVEKILNARQVKLEKNIKLTPEERKAASTARVNVLENKLSQINISKLTNLAGNPTFTRLLPEYKDSLIPNINKNESKKKLPEDYKDLMRERLLSEYSSTDLDKFLDKLPVKQKNKYKPIIKKIKEKATLEKIVTINGINRIPIGNLLFLKNTFRFPENYENLKEPEKTQIKTQIEKAITEELKKMIKGRNILNQEQGSREIETQQMIKNRNTGRQRKRQNNSKKIETRIRALTNNQFQNFVKILGGETELNGSNNFKKVIRALTEDPSKNDYLRMLNNFEKAKDKAAAAEKQIKNIVERLSKHATKKESEMLQNKNTVNIIRQIYSANTNAKQIFELAESVKDEIKTIEQVKKELAAEKAAAEKAAAAQSAKRAAAEKAATEAKRAKAAIVEKARVEAMRELIDKRSYINTRMREFREKLFNSSVEKNNIESSLRLLEGQKTVIDKQIRKKEREVKKKLKLVNKIFEIKNEGKRKKKIAKLTKKLKISELPEEYRDEAKKIQIETHFSKFFNKPEHNGITPEHVRQAIEKMRLVPDIYEIPNYHFKDIFGIAKEIKEFNEMARERGYSNNYISLISNRNRRTKHLNAFKAENAAAEKKTKKSALRSPMTTSGKSKRVGWSNEIKGNPLGKVKTYNKYKGPETIKRLKEVNVFATNI